MLASMTWTQWLLSVVLICVCLFLMLVILLQRGRGGGIASAFGGGGGSGAFGAKTGDVFTWITCIVAGIFVVLAAVANFAFDKSQLPTVDTPAVAADTEAAPKLIPVQMGDDGTALPINIEQLPVGATSGVQSITIKPSDLAPGAAPVVLPPGKDDAAMPVAPATPPPAEPAPAAKPKEEPATP